MHDSMMDKEVSTRQGNKNLSLAPMVEGEKGEKWWDGTEFLCASLPAHF